MNDIIKVSWNTNFTMIPNSLWDLPELSHEAFRVFTYLIRLGAKEEEASFPSYPTIAEKCQLLNTKKVFCKTKARRVIQDLEKIGLVKKLNRKNKKTGVYGSNLYTLTHPDTLLNVGKPRLTDDWDIISDTPCVTPTISTPCKASKIKGEKSDTPVSPVKLGATQPKSEVSDTYKDLSIKTLNNKTTTTSGSGEDFSFLNTIKFNGRSLSGRTIKNIISAIQSQEDPESYFMDIYNHCKNANTRSIGGLVDQLNNGKWEIENTGDISDTPTTSKDYRSIIKGITNNALQYGKDALNIFENNIKAEYPKELVTEYRNKLSEELELVSQF